MNRFPQLSVVMSLTALMLLFYSMGSASEFALMCESFARGVRATGISIAYASNACVFGETAQVVATWLIRLTGGKLAPGSYVAACVVLSLIAVSKKETANKAID
jgi:MHS family proline/betaine transporter-like MFS transporter